MANNVVLVDDGQGKVEVKIRGEHLTDYLYRSDLTRACLWPIIGPGGKHLTRTAPLAQCQQEADAGYTDHPHHKSIWSAWGEVNDVDFWDDGQHAGLQITNSITVQSGESSGVLHAQETWKKKDGTPIVDASKTIVFHDSPQDARIIDYSFTMKASYGIVKIGDTKEGGLLSMRMALPLAGSQKGTLSLSTGAIGEQAVWGQQAAWCDCSGPIDENTVCGIALMDCPCNETFPTRWHARDYGLIGANPFGLSYFLEGQGVRGDRTLDKGHHMQFDYRILLHAGDARQADVEGKFQEWISSCQL